MIRRRVALFLLLGCLAAGQVRSTSPPRFLLVDGEVTEALERRLQSAGSKGYRLIATAEGTDVTGQSRLAVLLERGSSGAKFDYAVRSGSGDLSDRSMQQAVDPLFEQGFRFSPRGFVVRRRPEVWLSESAYEDQATIVLEREARSRGGWVYTSLGFGTEQSFHAALDERHREGFEILGLWNTDRKLQVVLQRPIDRSVPAGDGSAGEHRLLLIATRRVLKVKLNNLAERGYRIRQAEDPPTVGPPMLLLRREAEVGAALDYRFVKAVPRRMRKDRFDRKLNSRAAKGWRLTPGGLTDKVVTLERDPGWEPDNVAEYRIVSSANAEELASRIEAAYSDGFSFVSLVVEPARTSVLLERSR